MASPGLDQERQDLLKEIYAAFQSAGRGGGVTWSESIVLDAYGTDAERAAARARDTEKRWMDLVDDAAWNPAPGVGGFSFLDRIGFRYYLAPAMVRCVRTGCDEGVRFHLTLRQDGLRQWTLEKWSLLDERQRACARRFLAYMIASCEKDAMDVDAGWWREALDSYWISVPGPATD